MLKSLSEIGKCSGIGITIITLITLVVSGCGSTKDATEEIFPSGDSEVKMLNPGGTVVGAGGAILKAPEGALDSSVSVAIESASDPTNKAPLPDEATPVGDYRQISASRNEDLDADSPLGLVMSVPDGVSPSNLAIGIVIPRNQVHQKPSPSTTHVWSITPGTYDPQENVIVFRIPFLSTQARDFVLLESSSYGSPTMNIVQMGANGPGSVGEQGSSSLKSTEEPVGSSVARSALGALRSSRYSMSFASGTNEESTHAQKVHRTKAPRFLRINFRKPKEDFAIRCPGMNGCKFVKSARSQLNNVYDDFVPGFNKPDLTRIDTKINGEPGAYYLFKLRKDNTGFCEDGPSGRYHAATKVAVNCTSILAPRPGKTRPGESTTRHEFFHAIQYNYPAINWVDAPGRPDWILEGTAEIAESPKSNATNAHREKGSDLLRNIDTPLTAISEETYPEYKVQDFWIHLINSNNSTPKDILGRLFQDPGIDRIARLVRSFSDFPRYYRLHDAHWDWVRNQAIEAKVTTGNNRLNGKCVFDPETVADLKTIEYDPAAQSGSLQESVTIDELSATMVRIRFKNTSESTYMGTVNAQSRGSSGRKQRAPLKFYRDTNSSSYDCTKVFGSTRSVTGKRQVPARKEKTAFLLMANSNHSGNGSITFDIEISHTKVGISITHPENGATFPEGELVNFEASVNLPTGGSRYRTRWTTNGSYAGVSPLYQRHSSSRSAITAPSTGLLCPGTHKIKATVSNDPYWQLSDQVTIEVKNRRPSVFLKSIPSNREVGSGRRLVLYAHAEDHSCTAGGPVSGNPSEIRWEVDGIEVDRGSALNYPVNEDPGTQIDVKARYTDDGGLTGESQTLTFRVTSAPSGSQPPTAVIKKPRAGATRHTSTGKIRLQAEASDPDGGAIQEVKWTVTGSRGNTQAYTGLEVTTDLWPELAPPNFEVKLTVTDDENQTYSTSIELEIIPGL